MLLSQYQELDALYPNHRLSEKDFTSLLAFVEEEEESVLIPILGDQLYERICEDYNKVINEKGGITVLQVEAPTLQVRIIRACQRVAFYRMLANNSGIFAIAFNLGGGLNTLSADSFDEANDKQRRDFERDVWNKSKRHTESLLMYLEKDARTSAAGLPPEVSTYSDLWKKSPYFYHHADLLFTTAQEMKPFYSISDRSEYINLIPTIRIIQNNYIAPAIGEHILSRLISQKYDSTDPSLTPESADPSLTPEGTDPSLSPEGGDPSPSPSPQEPSDTQALWHNLRTQVLTATAQFVKSRVAPQTPHVLQDADLALALCKKIVDSNPEVFPKPVLYQSPQKPSLASHDRDIYLRHLYNPDDSSNAILDLGSIAHNT